MTPQIRAKRAADIPRTFALIHEAFPCLVLTEEVMRWRFDHPPPMFADRHFVAVEGESLVGHVRSRLHTGGAGPRRGWTYLGALAAPHRNGDLAGRLIAASEDHLAERGATVLRTDAAEEGVQVGGERFRRAVLDRGGYELAENHHVLGMDLSRLPAPPTAPEGVETRRWTEFADDPRPLYEIDKATTADEPGEEDVGLISYEDWLETVWGNPLADLEISLALLVDGVPAAISCYVSDGDRRVESAMTGVLRQYRGRGLGGYAKNTALHGARARGFTHAFTGNHETNKPMLAINNRIGYALAGTESTYVKRL